MAPRGYKNPLRDIRGLAPNRIDQGVDYDGSGPLHPPGPGVIEETTNSGWPGGAFIATRLTSGPAAGNLWYEAEDISPSVQVGDRVTADSVLGQMWGPIEVGWGDPAAVGRSLAIASGQWDAANDPTAYGLSASNFVSGLGGPAGLTYGKPVQGTVPKGYNFPGRGTAGTGGNSGLGSTFQWWNPLSWPSGIAQGAAQGASASLLAPVEHLAIVAPIVLAAAAVGVVGLWQMTKGTRQAVEEHVDEQAGKAAQAAEVAAVAA